MNAPLRRTPSPGAPPRGYTVGITIFVKGDGTLGLYENGLRQNVVFLYRLFKASPNCARVFLLNHGDGEPVEDVSDLGVEAADILRTPKVLDQLDYVISLGAALDRETAMALRARGCRMINYKGGNGAVISMEAIIAKPPRADAERYFDIDYFDQIWMTPQHIHTYKGWCETLYRCPVLEAPQIWSPLFIDRTAAKATFGYKPGPKTWRVGALDPNITVMKTSHLPMLVCEAAYRARAGAFKAMYITNGWPHRENAHFKSFTLCLKSVQAGIMTLEPRFNSAEFLANHCDAVVTHQWENALNYLYYEVLRGGYPLIHNSSFLKGHGYYFGDFDAEDGGRALLAAVDRHDIELDAYKSRNEALFKRLDPENPDTIAQHEGLLEARVS